MNDFTYLGIPFRPYGNIIGKDEETRFQRLMWGTNTSHPLLSKEDGYDYEELYKLAGDNAADIYYLPQSKRYCVPTGSGIFGVDISGIKKYVRVVDTGGVE